MEVENFVIWALAFWSLYRKRTTLNREFGTGTHRIVFYVSKNEWWKKLKRNADIYAGMMRLDAFSGHFKNISGNHVKRGLEFAFYHSDLPSRINESLSFFFCFLFRCELFFIQILNCAISSICIASFNFDLLLWYNFLIFIIVATTKCDTLAQRVEKICYWRTKNVLENKPMSFAWWQRTYLSNRIYIFCVGDAWAVIFL